MTRSSDCYRIFNQSVADYHRRDDVDAPLENPYPEDSFEALCYHKNWIDTVQWHLEDIIRDPDINPVKGMELKRRIDRSNQLRTNVVEQMDDRFMDYFKGVRTDVDAPLNSETPAWLLDRMSILVLKIWHMREQVERTDATAEHLSRCSARLKTLQEQQSDLAGCFDNLMTEVASGKRKIKVYRQMKMYNDTTTNPVLYGKKS